MTLVVVAHDAGGAELLSSYLRQRGLRPLCVLDGPARAVFERKLGAVEFAPLREAVARATSVLCGTSWESNLEFDAMRLAVEHGKRGVAFLDHWVNYAERFVRDGVSVQPDEIWVADTIAAALARAHFADVRISVVENPYLTDCKAEYAAIGRRRDGSGGTRVLYVCEPVKEHARLRFGNERHLGYVEEEALRYFLATVRHVAPDVAEIRIRPHPSEPCGKYDWVRAESPVAIQTSRGVSLVQDLADCDVIVGCESMALVVALTVGKRAVSCIPPGGRPCRLPHPEIEHLQASTGRTAAHC
jgi:hypothetical protein